MEATEPVIYTLHGDRRAITVVARRDGGVRGYARALPRVFPYGRIVPGRRYAEITELWVGGECRRQGIGTGLIQELYAWASANGFTHLNAETDAMDDGLLAFWEFQAFVPRKVEMGLALITSEGSAPAAL